MPPKKPAPKKSEVLEKEANKMEDLVKVLRGQIEEERAKVNLGPRWAAAEEGPIKIDPHGKFAKKILAKKKPAPKAPPKEEIPEPPKPIPPEESVPQNPSPKKPKKIEVIVEKQAGALWGVNPEIRIPQHEEEEEINEEKGGLLWGSPPDETEESERFKKIVGKLRGEQPESVTQNTTSETGPEIKKKMEPTAFTYFDSLMNKNILDGTPYIK